jgi:uncharacterized protein (DUF427 family)
MTLPIKISFDFDTQISIVNQAFAIFKSNILQHSHPLIVTFKDKDYTIDVQISDKVIALTFNNETKTILTQGMYVDFYECANDIRRWFISRCSTTEELKTQSNYSVLSFVHGLLIDSDLMFSYAQDKNQLMIYSDAELPTVFNVTQDYTGYSLIKDNTDKGFHVGYQMMTGETSSSEFVKWIQVQIT